MDALARQAPDFTCHVVETEFWGAMATPNLMVESSVDDLADMMTALSFHVGEVQRNPYHLLVPAWMQDNVRRGGELVGGQGGAAPDFTFCTLYRLRRWSNGRLQATYAGGRLARRRERGDAPSGRALGFELPTPTPQLPIPNSGCPELPNPIEVRRPVHRLPLPGVGFADPADESVQNARHPKLAGIPSWRIVTARESAHGIS